MKDEIFLKLVAEADTIASFLRRVGRAVVGTNYRWFHKEVERTGADIRHFKKHNEESLRKIREDKKIPWGGSSC